GAGETAMAEPLALERRDWRRLVELIGQRQAGRHEGARRQGFLAAAHRLAGDDAACDRALAEARRLVEEDAGGGGSYLAVTGAMLLNDRMGSAVELLIEHRNYGSALEFLRYAARYEDALALVERARKEDSPE